MTDLFHLTNKLKVAFGIACEDSWLSSPGFPPTAVTPTPRDSRSMCTKGYRENDGSTRLNPNESSFLWAELKAHCLEILTFICH